MKRNHLLFIFLLFAIGLMLPLDVAEAKTVFQVSAQCEESPNATLRIKVSEDTYKSFVIYRSEAENGAYEKIGEIGNTAEDDYDGDYDCNDDYYESYGYDTKNKCFCIIYSYMDYNLQVGKTYYYRVDAYGNDGKTISKTAQVEILSAGPRITYGKRNGKLGAKLKWTKVDNADGYLVYCVKNYDDKSNYVAVDVNDLSKYTQVKTVKNPNTLTASLSKLKNGVTYTYRVCSYQNVNGKKVLSTFSSAKAVLMNYYSYDGESYSQRIKRAFGSEKKKKSNYKTAKKAAKQMKRIKIKVWDYQKGKKGKKVTKTKYLTVNKKLAPSIQQMFAEIYKSKEKQVIKDIGCYSYRTGEHMYGMAIDINPNENYMIDKVNGKKKILSGSYWKPKKDPYSIPSNCEMVRIMRRYGFYRGDWGDRKDYMHFSYFGT